MKPRRLVAYAGYLLLVLPFALLILVVGGIDALVLVLLSVSIMVSAGVVLWLGDRLIRWGNSK